MAVSNSSRAVCVCVCVCGCFYVSVLSFVGKVLATG